ncbi:Fe-S cluster assembly protein SufD [Pacificimonas flava]|uniref:Fe-S cluster assembly protein SufD n=2 Tax=Pacificimonas TaxID=1960290 RepID=A0A219B397_9SPHN|nr:MULTISPECIES: SufD family Fe-S cluster assembly protein [Pacificimonas]MBZ6377726.1 SufD family Fe-S cluster assembly protein [Pacificimonas aurantium]OWV32596.1 Fe-S cluster assembly protein SufD [Pacificimonas flava]
MSERPTKKDEAWRYADFDALKEHWPDSADRWETVDVAAGETKRELVRLLPDPDLVSDVTRLKVTVGDGGRYELFALAARSRYGRLEIEATLGDGAHFEFGGAIIGKARATNEFIVRVNHEQPNATSNQTVRAVLADKATGSFLGKVYVARGAQKTDGSQSSKAMLLDRTATANLKPELEIYADDVKCAHGATVGELDKRALFYMASRGIPPEIAERLMLQTFVAEGFAELGDDKAREALEADALGVLEALR